MSSKDQNNYGTAFSYATENEDNELTVTDYNGFVLSVAGEKVVTDVTATDGQWHFICVSWRAARGEWWILRDGLLADQGTGLAAGRTVEAGGLVVLGQEQDEKGGQFSVVESFQGQITRLDVWRHVLTQEEVLRLVTSCHPYFGNLLAWTDVLEGLRGHIQVRAGEAPCPGGRAGVLPWLSYSTGTKAWWPPDRRWGHHPPQCPGSPATGAAQFSCLDGHRLQGRHTLYCSIFGEWDAQPPTCQCT